MIAPLAIIGDIHTLFILTSGRCDGAIDIDDGLTAKRCGLLAPDPTANPVFNFQKFVDILLLETPEKVTGSGRVRYDLGA